MTDGGMSRSNRLLASVVGLLLFIAVQFVIFIDYGVTVQLKSDESTVSSKSIQSSLLKGSLESLASTLSLGLPSTLPPAPMKQSEWKHYLKEKYSDVFESTLKFELISLFTPQVAPDDEPHDVNYHMDNAPRKAVKIYKKWLEMQQEIKVHDDAVRAWKAARRASGNGDSDDSERDEPPEDNDDDDLLHDQSVE